MTNRSRITSLAAAVAVLMLGSIIAPTQSKADLGSNPIVTLPQEWANNYGREAEKSKLHLFAFDSREHGDNPMPNAHQSWMNLIGHDAGTGSGRTTAPNNQRGVVRPVVTQGGSKKH
jgi:hypothetical protein